MDNPLSNVVVGLIFIVCIAYLGYVPGQGDFFQIIIPYSVLFGSYLYLVKRCGSFRWLLTLAVVARFLLIFTVPNLSDDIYRFIWDGRSMHAGLSPYGSLPSGLVGTVDGLDTALFELLNSPEYYSLYPPIAQVFNYCSTLIGTESYIGEAIIYKSMLFLCDLVLMWLFYKIVSRAKIHWNRMFLYLLNPLIIIEINGNVHFEGVMILFLAASLYLLLKSKHMAAGAALGASVASKMLTMMYSVAMFFYTPAKQRLPLVLGAVVMGVLLFLPVVISLHQDGANILTSLDLYVKKFEFNGSLYYLLRAIGYEIYGYNTIHIWGPKLSIATLLAILFISYKTRQGDFLHLLQIIFWCTIIFLVTSRTVHPWYLSLAIFSSVFTRFRFPILWSYLIFFTYINYSYAVYEENLVVVFIEYGLVLLYACYEWRIKKPQVALT